MSVIRTEGEGQAKDIMEIMSDADAVLVAGGDGTVMETVTGFMRKGLKPGDLPLGVLPVGENNMLAKSLFPGVTSDVALMAHSAMAVVKRLYRPLAVIEVENVAEDERFKGKKIYGMSELRMGAFRDCHERMGKYWYWAGLKKAMTYVFGFTTSAKEVLWACSGQIHVRGDPVVTPEEVETSRSYWDYIWPRSDPNPSKNRMSAANNHHWDVLPDFGGSEIAVTIAENRLLRLDLGPNIDEVAFPDFVMEGYGREKGSEAGHRLGHQTRRLETAKVKFVPDEKMMMLGEKEFSLDNEAVELVGPLAVELLPDKVVMFCAESMQKSIPPTEEAENPDLNKKWWQRSIRKIA